MNTTVTPEQRQAFLRDIEPIMKMKMDVYRTDGMPVLLRDKTGEVVYGSVEFPQEAQARLAMFDRIVARVAARHGVPWVDPD